MSWPQIAAKRPLSSQRVEEPLREPFELVGAHRQPMARRRQAVEHRFNAGKRPRAVGDMLGIVGDEGGVEGVDVGGRGVAALQDQRPLDHALRAAADQRPGGVVGNRRQAVLREGEIERVDQVGGRVDQRAVEIEDDGEHGFRVALATCDGARQAVRFHGDFALHSRHGRRGTKARRRRARARFRPAGDAAWARHRLDRQALCRFARRARRGGPRHRCRADLRSDARAGRAARHRAHHARRDAGARSHYRRRRRDRAGPDADQGRRRRACCARRSSRRRRRA